MSWNEGTGNNAPCFGCPDREAGCHSVCEPYISYKAEREAIRKASYEEKSYRAYKSGRVWNTVKRSGLQK